VFPRSALVPAAAFAALAGLVAAGALTAVDQWGVEQLMPGAHFHAARHGLAEGLVPLLGAHWHGGLAIAANIVTLPASFVISLALVAWRSRPLAASLVAAVVVEVVCKELLVRPALHDGAFHIGSFDSSFPSGHTLRTVIVAAAFWPSLGLWAAAWAVASVVLLQLAGWHTPSDVAGGLVLGLLALLCAGGAGALGRRRGRLRA
jgi:membrane-associated phospholipid phosphatase